jgi:uncharacterized protein (TIRG00374 family)
MKEKSKSLIRYAIAIILVIASVYYAIKDVNLARLWQIIINAEYIWVFLPIPVMLLSHWVRAMRWRTMLEPVTKAQSTWNLFSAVMVGYAVNNVLPRGGEFLRPYVYARREKISFTTVFATIIVERFIDLVTLVLLFCGVFFFFRGQLVQALPNIHLENLMIPTAMVLAVLILAFYPPFVMWCFKFLVRPLSHNLYDKLVSLFEKFQKGFQIIKKPSQYLRLIIESWVIWLFYTIPLYLMFFSFHFDTRFGMGFDDAILLIVISGIGTTIAPTPGAIGIYHYLIQQALMKLYGISAEEALAYATLTHGINYLVQVIVGGLFLLRENIQKIPHKEDMEAEMNMHNV